MGCGVTVRHRSVALLLAVTLASLAWVPMTLATGPATGDPGLPGLTDGPGDAERGSSPADHQDEAAGPGGPPVPADDGGSGDAAADLLARLAPGLFAWDGCGPTRGDGGSAPGPVTTDPDGPDQAACSDAPTPTIEDLGADDGKALSALDAIHPADPTRPSHGARPGASTLTTTGQAAPAVPGLGEASWPVLARIVLLAAAGAAAVLVPIVLASRGRGDNDVRRRVLDLVVAEPGVTASGIAEALDVHLTTAIYHLNVLKEEGRIEGVRRGRSTRWFENHRRFGRLEKRLLTALKTDTASELLGLVADNPGIHGAELARRLDLSRTSVKWHTDRLLDEGLLKQERRDGRVRLEVPARTNELMEQYGPAP